MRIINFVDYFQAGETTVASSSRNESPGWHVKEAPAAGGGATGAGGGGEAIDSSFSRYV